MADRRLVALVPSRVAQCNGARFSTASSRKTSAHIQKPALRQQRAVWNTIILTKICWAMKVAHGKISAMLLSERQESPHLLQSVQRYFSLLYRRTVCPS
jgi:hypothetical protein